MGGYGLGYTLFLDKPEWTAGNTQKTGFEDS